MRQMWFFVAAIVIAFVAVVALSVEESKKWSKFAAENNCRVVAKERASVLVGTDGKSMISAGKTAYQCDDGVVYWR